MLQVNALAFSSTLCLSFLSLSLLFSLSVCAAGHCNCWPFNKRFRPNSAALLRMTASWPLPQVPTQLPSCPAHLPRCLLALPAPCSPLSNEPWLLLPLLVLLLLLLLQSARFLCVPLSKIEFQIIFTQLSLLLDSTTPTFAHLWHSALD